LREKPEKNGIEEGKWGEHTMGNMIMADIVKEKPAHPS